MLLLPGSRTGEITRLLPDMLETVRRVHGLGRKVDVSLVTLHRHQTLVAGFVAGSGVPVEVVTGDEAKWRAFAAADAALAASGTVSLELALCGVPHVSLYKADWIARTFIIPRIISWSANLPNLIAGEPFVPEHYEDMVRPAMLARLMAALMTKDHPMRTVQAAGMAKVAKALATERPAADIAAARILSRVGVVFS
jgi:lipid-A-disaccharide synthase